MPAWSTFSYFYGPLCALLGVGVLMLILRWTYARGKSVVAAPPRSGASDQYGLLVPVARPGSVIEGELLRRKLEGAGLRANLAETLDGPRVMVWPADLARATEVLKNSRP
ncbi:MAG: hypothetical protein Q7L55_07930 [Actinomycetota bacterium]|nr:hypothetical protein [Actinomycetota bacterium]